MYRSLTRPLLNYELYQHFDNDFLTNVEKHSFQHGEMKSFVPLHNTSPTIPPMSQVKIVHVHIILYHQLNPKHIRKRNNKNKPYQHLEAHNYRPSTAQPHPS